MVYIDMFSKAYETCTFDNLPPSQAVPNTFGMKLPKKLQYHSLSGKGSDIRAILAKVDKALKSMKTGGDRTLVMIDNLNMLMLGAGPLEWLEVIGDWCSWADTPGVSVCIGVNRDLLDPEVIDIYREAKNASFDHILELQRNLSGYTKDVHG